MRYVLILVAFIFTCTAISCNKRIVDAYKSFEPKDNKIFEQRLNFYCNDSVYPFVVCTYPNGDYRLYHKLHDSLCSESLLSYKLDGVYRDKYIYRDSLLSLFSYFPVLIKHDSSFFNHYTHLIDFEYKMFYEPKYTYLLSQLNEPNISNVVNKQIIRITPDFDYNKDDNKPQRRYSLRLEIHNEKDGKLFLSEGVIDSLAIFKVTHQDSCIIKNKELAQIVKMIQKIDFKKQYIFAEIGIDIDEKFLFEFKDSVNYIVLERAFFNEYHNNFPFTIIYSMFLALKKEYFKY